MNQSDATPYILADFDEDGLTGSISIDPGVLVEMIEVTADSIPAISRIAGSRRGVARKKHLIAADGPEPDQGDGWFSQRGVRVRIIDESLEASVNVVLRHGTSVPAVAAEIQEQVSVVVEKMFGLRTESLAVHVTGFDPEQTAE